MKKNKAFTLIELLIVIAVLAGFMAMLVPNYMQARIKSRDVRRKTDLKNLQKALELYKQNQSLPVYPDTLAKLTANIKYMQTVPTDPQSVSYYYAPVLDAFGNYSSYTLCACLENINDSEQAPPVTCVGASTCTGKYYKLTDP